MDSYGTWHCIVCDTAYTAKGSVKAHWHSAKAQKDTAHRGKWNEAYAEWRAAPVSTALEASHTNRTADNDHNFPLVAQTGHTYPDPSEYEISQASSRPNAVFARRYQAKHLPSEPQFRSSRTTRNFDPSQVRGRGGIDHDPTEGLPVQKWRYDTVTVQQDAAPTENHATQNEDQNDDYPWPEHTLPAFFHQLPPHSQALLRRSRMGSRNTETSKWDRKTETYYRESERQAAKQAAQKSTLGPDTPTNANDDDMDDAISEAIDDDAIMGQSTTEPGLVPKKPTNEPRTFTHGQWVKIPAAEAENMPERSFLAARRPGMPSLYGQYGAANSIGLTNTIAAGGAAPPLYEAAGATVGGVDLGDGSGLGDAGGLLGGGVPTPVRKGPPPRKKRKKGGPGRRKAMDLTAATTADSEAGEVKMGGVGDEGGEVGEAVVEEGEAKEGEESGSETEGSEDGEVKEGVVGVEEEEKREEGGAPVVAAPETAGEDLLSGLEAAVNKAE